MKNKSIILKIIVVVVLCLFIFFGYKLFMLNKYTSQKVDFDTDAIFNEKIVINNTISLDKDEILKVGEITIKNYFTDYVKHEETSDFKVKYDENGEVMSFYTVSSRKQYVNFLNLSSFELHSTDTEKKVTSEPSQFFKENNLVNDIEFLNHIKENYYIKNNLFTSVNDMKNNYLVNSFVEVSLPAFEKIVLIEGRLNGYIIDSNSGIREIHILNDSLDYIILLGGEEITSDEFVQKLLETVKF